jgi:glycosyltransferase involved in cell wall biosynthesis
MRLRVLHIELGRHLYGGAKQVTYLLNALAETHGIENHLLCPKDSEINLASIANCQKHPIAYKGEADVLGFIRIKRLCDAIKPDVLHIHSRRGADVWGALLAKLSKIPAVCTRRVDNKETTLAKYKYRQYAAVVSISKGVHDVVKQHCSHVHYQSIIHSSVKLDDFEIASDKRWLYQHFAIPKDHKVIANFAQLISRKGQADIIMAMQKVIKATPNVTCLLFGQGKLHAYYQSLIDEHRLTDHIKLCGFSEQVDKILPCIDIVLHPAYAEGLGVILLQAGACKRAVISCPVGGIPEIIEDEKTGVMVSPGNIQELAKAIIRLLYDEVRCKQLGENLYAHVCTHFNPTYMAKSYTTLYRQVVNI